MKGSAPDVFLVITTKSTTATQQTRTRIHYYPLQIYITPYLQALGSVTTVADSVLTAIPLTGEMAIQDGLLLKGDGSQGEDRTRIYMTERETRRVIPDADTFSALRLNSQAVKTVPDAALKLLPAGPPIPRPANMYVYTLESFHIDKTRARHRDTDTVGVELRVGKVNTPRVQFTNYGYQFKKMGDMDDGDHPVGITLGPVPVANDDNAIFGYAIVNDPGLKEADFSQSLDKLSYKGLYDLMQQHHLGPPPDPKDYLGVGVKFTMSLDGPVWSPTGSFSTALWGVINPNCNGLVAMNHASGTSADLLAWTSGSLIHRESTFFPGYDSPSGCGSNSRYTVTWSIRRIGGLEVRQTALAFGLQRIGSTSYQGLELRNLTRSQTLHVSHLHTSDPHFTVSPDSMTLPPAGNDGNGGSGMVSITFAPNAAGNFAGNLLMDTDDLERPTLSLPLSGAGGAGTLGVEPASLDLGSVPVSQTTIRPLTLRNTGNLPLTVGAQLPANTPFRMGSPQKLTLQPGESDTLSILFTPTATGPASTSLTLSSQDSAHPSLVVPLAGTGAPAQAKPFSVTPAQLALRGQTGETTTRAVTIKNEGSQPLHVALTTSGAPFQVSASAADSGDAQSGAQVAVSLAPGATQQVYVVFSPERAGQITGLLTATGDDPGHSAATVQLSGSAVPPRHPGGRGPIRGRGTRGGDDVASEPVE